MTHYGAPGATGKDATMMGYATGTSWTLDAADVPAHKAGDVINFYVQAMPVVAPSGKTDVEKAQALNVAQVTGSAWSELATIKF